MSDNQFKLFPITIQYVEDDELLHTAANGYRCGLADCICADIPSFADTQKMLMSFAQHPGTLSRIDAVMHRRKITSQLEEETPTNVLPRWHGDIPAMSDETFRLPERGRQHRRRVSWWHRVKQWFTHGK